ncbi:hypothetical protein COT99_01140 [Candidatus Falkowbacteria bacterium CG10_big_fil_rev_8_21_14_0_10_43_10]|uniref:DUF4190 domain-containing protein n=1 Tax=Candidatus Falkowbacteria bacterium CG10_big_fil_rev_8_21_14_0_10_43_10 TaxID=1974567 RepID=A0A2H0V2S6_9BACT|nr:MAG: hypothetical protein COT99_01140 [Candidatus Falkowbacteria bacterium CG10_big_fil_rev_8_21_14_0_10_43_10]
MLFKKIVICLSLILTLFFTTTTVSASNQGEDRTVNNRGGGTVQLNDPLNLPKDGTGPQILIGRIIQAVLGLVGSLALIMFIYGGLLWMTAGGKEEKVTQGKNILIWATLGLLVIFAAYGLVYFVIYRALLGQVS